MKLPTHHRLCCLKPLIREERRWASEQVPPVAGLIVGTRPILRATLRLALRFGSDVMGQMIFEIGAGYGDHRR